MLHSVLGASSSKRWLTCPGSVQLFDKVADSNSTKFAAEGTAAHELGETCLLENKNARDFKGSYINDFLVNDDMIDAVQLYVDTIREETKGLDLKVEQMFDLSFIHKGMFGTNDASAGEPFGTLKIYDYKHGAGIPVEVVDNTQMMYYAIGAAHGEDYTDVEMVIVQPRAFHVDGPVRRWKISIKELNDFAKVLKRGAIATTKKNAKLKAGEHCRFCPALAICPERRKENHAIAVAAFSDGEKFPKPETLSDKQIQRIIEAKSELTMYITAVENHAFNRMEKGDKIKGLKLVRKRKKRTWIDEADTRVILERRGFSMNEILETKLKTVSKMEKQLGKKAVEEFIMVEETGLTLAPEKDKRDGVELNITDAFTKIKKTKKSKKEKK
jgi:hypothetical protein